MNSALSKNRIMKYMRQIGEEMSKETKKLFPKNEKKSKNHMNLYIPVGADEKELIEIENEMGNVIGEEDEEEEEEDFEKDYEKDNEVMYLKSLNKSKINNVKKIKNEDILLIEKNKIIKKSYNTRSKGMQDTNEEEKQNDVIKEKENQNDHIKEKENQSDLKENTERKKYKKKISEKKKKKKRDERKMNKLRNTRSIFYLKKEYKSITIPENDIGLFLMNQTEFNYEKNGLK
jgi:hypothetical protein